MSLTDTKIKSLKPTDKRRRIADVDGLYIEIAPNGKRRWLFRYTKDKKQLWHTLGEYPLISLREAREMRDKARKDIFYGLRPDGTDPNKISFRDISERWLDELEATVKSEGERFRSRKLLEKWIYPHLGSTMISDIRSVDILEIVRAIANDEKKISAAHSVLAAVGRAFRYAVISGYCEYDVTSPLKGVLPVAPVKHMASITQPSEVGRLILDLRTYPSLTLRSAALFSAYTFCRPGEIRTAEWSEISFTGAEWRIPASKMKMKRPHIVPLSRQAITILDDLRAASGDSRWVFPNTKDTTGMTHISCHAVAYALLSLGYPSKRMTPHGFRSMASTILNENGFNSDWIERQLAHMDNNKIRASYNHADFLPDRRKMMQWYADHLDKLAATEEFRDRRTEARKASGKKAEYWFNANA